jgi:hypothetical protein
MIEQLHDMLMSYSIFDFAKSIPQGERLIFDVDATAVEKFGAQEGVQAWRCDSGYFNENAFDLFSENDATFFIKAPMSATRLSLASSSPDLIWSPEVDGICYASRATGLS